MIVFPRLYKINRPNYSLYSLMDKGARLGNTPRATELGFYLKHRQPLERAVSPCVKNFEVDPVITDMWPQSSGTHISSI